jgi:hypothetical protein
MHARDNAHSTKESSLGNRRLSSTMSRLFIWKMPLGNFFSSDELDMHCYIHCTIQSGFTPSCYLSRSIETLNPIEAKSAHCREGIPSAPYNKVPIKSH